MAQKITGQTIDMGDGGPLVDVDTAVLDLLEDVARAGRQRQHAALAQLITFARGEHLAIWAVYDDGVRRSITSMDRSTREIVLAPMEAETGEDDA